MLPCLSAVIPSGLWLPAGSVAKRSTSPRSQADAASGTKAATSVTTTEHQRLCFMWFLLPMSAASTQRPADATGAEPSFLFNVRRGHVIPARERGQALAVVRLPTSAD